MQAFRPFAIAVLLGCLPALGACSASPSGSSAPAASAASSSPHSIVAAAIDGALTNAKQKLATQNITISGQNGSPDYPKAEITPKGDLLIGGKAVTETPAQRAQVLAYRGQIIAIADAGIAIGRQGANIGMSVAGEAIELAFSGASHQQIKQKIDAQTSGIRAAAAGICKELPALMAEQQKLAAALPAFRPYATMTEKDITDCHVDNADSGD